MVSRITSKVHSALLGQINGVPKYVLCGKLFWNRVCVFCEVSTNMKFKSIGFVFVRFNLESSKIEESASINWVENSNFQALSTSNDS